MIIRTQKRISIIYLESEATEVVRQLAEYQTNGYKITSSTVAEKWRARILHFKTGIKNGEIARLNYKNYDYENRRFKTR